MSTDHERLRQMVEAYNAGAYRDSEAVENLAEMVALVGPLLGSDVDICTVCPVALDVAVAEGDCDEWFRHGHSGQDRESYTDEQDRESYT